MKPEKKPVKILNPCVDRVDCLHCPLPPNGPFIGNVPPVLLCTMNWKWCK